MARSSRFSALPPALVVLAVLALLAATLSATAPPASAFGYQDLSPLQKRLVSGLMAFELGEGGAAARAGALGRVQPAPSPLCSGNLGFNIKVNQNCVNPTDPDFHGRGQAQNETWMAADPANPRHLVATFNDYRRGDGTCGVAYSLDGGRRWTDATMPTNFTRGTAFGKPRQYWQAGGDPSAAWDTRGNAYYACLMFNRGLPVSPHPDQSSAMYVFRSTGTNGASWHFPGRPVAEHPDPAGAGGTLLDKQFMTVDANVRSPFRDRVYVTWTTFAADGTAYIFGAYSADYGEHFSAPVLVSADSPACQNAQGLPVPRGRCNVNQFSQPFTGADGTLYVVFSNYNNAVTAPDNRNQVLLARSTDGGATFSAPVRVGDFYELPDCPTYQNGKNPGRACVPEKGATANSFFRAANYPLGAVDPRAPGRVVVTYGSYISRSSQESTGCTPAGFSATGNNLYIGVKTGGCNNDILLSVSTDSGRTFTGGATDPRRMPVVTAAPGQGRTDQFWQGVAFSPQGRMVVGYYDRQYGTDETTGYSDYTLSADSRFGGRRYLRVTTSSMPPPTQFEGVFYGDYNQLAVTAYAAHPLWSDTRNPAPFLCPGSGTPTSPPRNCTMTAPNAPLANDQEAYTAVIPLGR